MRQDSRRLSRLIAVVVTAGVTTVALAVIGVDQSITPSLWRIGVCFALLTASRLAVLHLRLRGQRVDFDWGEGALLLGLVLLPTSWLTVLTPCSIATAGLLLKKNAVKTVYNAASATVATAVAGTVGHFLYDTTSAGFSWRLVGALAVASLLFTVIADLTASAAIALSQSEPFLRTLRVGVGMEALTGAGNVGAALAVVAIARFDPWLLAILPMLVVSLQITYGSRLRGQQERHAWTQLEKTTRAFTQLDPAAVADAAITGISALFQADWVEVQFLSPNGRESLYSGGPGGPAAGTSPPGWYGPTVTESLGQRDELVGNVTLHFSADVALNARERHALATLAAALAVALANADRYETTRKLAEDKAKEAVTDPLTGVGNRTKLHQAGPQLLCHTGQAPSGVLLLVDIDHLKEVNDTLGYDTGDRLLVEVAQRIVAVLSQQDLVVRLGSHVFAVLLAGTTGQQAEALANHLISTLDAPMVLDGLHLRAPSTIGIASAPCDAESIHDLLRLADAALLRAKNTGVRSVRYAADQDQPHADRLVTVEESRTGIINSEFLLHYQPKVDVTTGWVTASRRSSAGSTPRADSSGRPPSCPPSSTRRWSTSSPSTFFGWDFVTAPSGWPGTAPAALR